MQATDLDGLLQARTCGQRLEDGARKPLLRVVGRDAITPLPGLWLAPRLRPRLTVRGIAVRSRHSRLQEVEERLLSPRPANDSTARPSLGRGRLLLRFALGMTELTGERVAAVLAACSAVASPSPETTAAGAPFNLRHAALGILSDAAGSVSRAPARARARWRRLATSARQTGAPLAGLGNAVGTLPGMRSALGHLRAWRTNGGKRLARWAEVGRREEAESRALASDALTVLRENMLARVSESPDVKNVIREQSEGIAVTAMGQLRERSARADNLAERTVGRLFRGGRNQRPR